MGPGGDREAESNDGVARVIYKGKNSGVRETFVALDWLARLVTHIPNRGEQLVRYYGYYSNKSRGMRKKTIKEILLHLDLWMPGNHDPPNFYKEHQYIPASKPSGPSYDTTHDDYVLQMPYEDEYSQLTPYEDCI